MREWFTASELVNYAGLPTTERGIRKKATTENWHSRDRIGRGGGKEYHISSLPEATRTDIIVKQKQETGESIAEQKEVKQQVIKIKKTVNINGMRENDLKRLNARLTILEAWRLFKANTRLPVVRSMQVFAENYNNGEIEVESAVLEVAPTVSTATLKRWKKQQENGEFKRLAGVQYGKNKGVIESSPELSDFIKAYIEKYPHANAKHIERALHTEMAHLPLPGYRTIVRYLTTFKQENPALFAALTNPDEYKNKSMAAFGSLSDAARAFNDIWELDSTPADIMCADGKRYNIMAAIDVHTRRVVMQVTDTSNAEGVCTLIRKCVLKWGVPKKVRIDNGADYKSKRVTSALAALDITREVAAPYTPEHKPHIERFFRTMSMQLEEIMPGYIGHNVADRQKIEGRLSFAKRLELKENAVKDEVVFGAQITAEELQATLDAWCDNVYEREVHGSLKGKSPLETYMANTAPLRIVEDERVLDMLLADTHGTRVVTKQGLRIDNATFIAPELALYINHEVRVFHDPADLGRVMVYKINDAEDPFICVAECPERTGIDRREISMHAKKLQREMIKEGRKVSNALSKRLKVDQVTEHFLISKAQEAGKVALLPKAQEKHETNMLKAVTEAIKEPEVKQKTQLTKTQQEIFDKLETQPKAEIIKVETKEIRFKRWLNVDKQIELNKEISSEDQKFWEKYQTTAEFIGEKMTREAFGETIGHMAVNAN